MTSTIYPDLKGTDRVKEACGKCGGDGVVHWGNVTLAGVVKGRLTDGARICFDCNGRGETSVLVSSIRARARRAEKAAQEAEERAARYAAEAAARRAEEEAEEARREAERLAAEPVPTGRVEVTGEIVGRKFVSGYGYNSPDVLKIVVRDDRGFKVYGTAPAALGAAERGTRVAFTAAVEPSRDDDRFGFYKRPTKARIV